MVRASVIILVAVAFLAGCSDTPGRGPATASPPATASAGAAASITATATSPALPATVAGKPLKELVLGPPVEFPEHTVMYVATSSCANCGFAPGQLWRIHRNGQGQLVAGPAAPEGYVPLYALSPDASEIIAALCTGYCGGEGYPSEDASLRFTVSHDGGITWQPLSGPAFARTAVWFGGWYGGQVVANATAYLPSNLIGHVETYLLPSFARLTPPASVLQSQTDATEFPQAMTGPGGKLFWIIYRSRAQQPPLMFDETGKPAAFAQLEAILPGVEWQDRTYGNPNPGGSGVWFAVRGQQDAPDLYVQTGPGGEPVAGFFTNVRGVTFATPVSATGWLGTAIVPLDPGQEPGGNENFRTVLIDTTTGLMHPIKGLSREGSPLPGNFTWPRLALQGEFLRVRTGSPCLDVREQPSLSSLALGCFNGGVLLRARPEPRHLAEGITWLAVATPDGRAGWANAEFLEP